MAILIKFPSQVKSKTDVVNFFVNYQFDICEEIVYLYYFNDNDTKICYLNTDNYQEEDKLVNYFNSQRYDYPRTKFQINPEKYYPQVFINYLPENLDKKIILSELNKYGKVIKFIEKNGEILRKSQSGNYYVNVKVENEDVAQNIVNALNNKTWANNDTNKRLYVKYDTLSDYFSKFQLVTEEQEDFLQEENYILITDTLREFVTLLCNKIDTQRK